MEINDLIKKRYRILELLGEGGMAFVFKAKDEQLERNVAIKTLKPIYISDSNFVSRFKREAQTAANLNHPNIVHKSIKIISQHGLMLVVNMEPR